MADELIFFSAAAAAKIAEIVRREMGKVKNLPGPRGNERWGDNERAIDGISDGACSVDSLGVCIPNIPVGDEGIDGIPFWNSLADIEDGARIVILFSHRSATDATRNHGVSNDIPTPWILGPATCSE